MSETRQNPAKTVQRKSLLRRNRWTIAVACFCLGKWLSWNDPLLDGVVQNSEILPPTDHRKDSLDGVDSELLPPHTDHRIYNNNHKGEISATQPATTLGEKTVNETDSESSKTFDKQQRLWSPSTTTPTTATTATTATATTTTTTLKEDNLLRGDNTLDVFLLSPTTKSDETKNKKKEQPQKQQQLFHAAAVMLVGPDWRKQRKGRNCWFNRSMDALQQYWHPTNPYKIILQREFPWPEKDQQAIRDKWPSMEFEFKDISKQFLAPQPPAKMRDGRDSAIEIGYKRMCTYKSFGFLETPAIQELDYAMLIDDDSCFLEPVPVDVFQEMKAHNIAYAYKQLMTEYAGWMDGLDHFIDQYIKEHNITMANPDLRKKMSWGNGKGQKNYKVFSTNLEWIDLNNYRGEDISSFFKAVRDSRMIFHRRWGDAPLRSSLAYLFWNRDQIMRVCTAYVHGKRPPSKQKCDVTIIRDSVLKTLLHCHHQWLCG